MISRRFLIGLAVCIAPSLAQAQSGDTSSRPPAPPTTSFLTIITEPGTSELSIHGSSDLRGRAPLDVPPLMSGIHKVMVQGPGISRTQGIIYLPQPGKLPFVVSESPGVSLPLILRGLNFPGVTQFMGGRPGRGFPFAAAAFGSGFMAVRGQLTYRDRLDEVGEFAADRARDERYGRNAWLIYAGVVWGLNAVDYWIRPRFAQAEATPTRLTLRVPVANRSGALWRSILVPGAGQEYANHRTRSIVWLATVLGSGAMYVVTDYRVRRDETDQYWAQVYADSAGPSEQALRNSQLDQANRSLSASKDIRTGAAIATMSFYALNLFDAMFMYVNLKDPEGTKVSSITPVVTPDGPGVAVHLRF